MPDESGFSMNDRRTSRSSPRASRIVTGETPAQAREAMRRSASSSSGSSDPRTALGRGYGGDRLPEHDDWRSQRIERTRMRKRAYAPAGSSTVPSMSFATMRPQDPMFYWQQNNLPWDISKAEELQRIRAFCNTPDAPIWMGDYSFKPIGEVQPGDEVIGWEWRPAATQMRKRLTRTRVLAVQRRMAPEVVKVTMESGRVIRCTPDHLWANPHFSPNYGEQRDWQQPEYRAAKEGRYLTQIIEPTPELADEKSRLVAAWLGGLYDGEGCGEGIAQSASHNPEVCERIALSLDFLGLPWTRNDHSFFIRTSGHSSRPAAQHLVNFLNWTQPTRRTTTAIDKALLRQPQGGRDRIVSIESEGPGEVVSMQTETGNYVAWGYASKNCRILYQTHPLIASAIDIFSKYPLVGMEMVCKDSMVTEFYEELMFEQLNYEEYAVDIGREYWTVGEAWPLASWDEDLGIFEADELLNPDDVFVESSPFLREPHFSIRLPESLRNILRTGNPPAQYAALMRSYPELKNFMNENARMPISGHLLKQLRFKGDTFNPRGVPILLRAIRAIRQEEMLNAAQDAIADRLYTPLILARLGASASDLGTPGPWVPTPGQIQDFEDALDAALAADFRVLTTHFAVQMDTVFGRETMPNLDADFERLAERQLLAFGLSKTLLMGAGTGETYAADALNRDLVSQLLTTWQRMVKRLMRDRMLVVAEAQRHYDYEIRGGTKYPVMEEIRVVDENGDDKIIEQPKLLVPEVRMRTMNLHSEQDERQFIEALAAEGIPISMKTRMVNIPIDLKDEIETSRKEKVELAVEAMETRKETFQALQARNLPIPMDLVADFQPKALDAAEQDQAAPNMRLPQLGVDDAPQPAIAPTMNDMMMPPAPTDGQMQQQQQMQPGAPGAPAGPPAAPAGPPVPGATRPSARPPESDEMRRGMPRASSKTEEGGVVVKLPRSAYSTSLGEDPYAPATEEELAEVHLHPTDHMEEVQMDDNDPNSTVAVRSSLASGPSHIGMRRVAAHRGLVAKNKPLDEEAEDTA